MNTSFDDLLKAIEKYGKPETVVPETLITSGNRTRNWLKERIAHNSQILLNAIEYDEQKRGQPYDHFMHEIKSEFEFTAKVHCLPFPYDDIAEMTNVVSQLIEYYGGAFSAAEATIKMDPRPSHGYLIVTIIPTHVIK